MLVSKPLARLHVKLAGSMPNGLVGLGGRITLAFLRNDMQHLRTFVVLDLVQYAHQPYYVVPVSRTEIPDIQALEDIIGLLGKSSLEVVVETQQFGAFVVGHKVQLHQRLISPPAQFVVPRRGGQIHQVLRKPALDRVDSHVVVVQHD